VAKLLSPDQRHTAAVEMCAQNTGRKVQNLTTSLHNFKSDFGGTEANGGCNQHEPSLICT
jgi:hypothetical protein